MRVYVCAHSVQTGVCVCMREPTNVQTGMQAQQVRYEK